MCFWDGEFLQGGDDVPQINPIKKFQKEKMNINVVPPWNLKQLYSDIKFSKFQNPKRQVTSFQKTPGLVVFFQWNIYPSGGVVFFVYRTGLPQTHVVLFHRSHVTWFSPHGGKVPTYPWRSFTEIWFSKGERRLFMVNPDVFFRWEKIRKFDKCNKNTLKNGLDLDRTTI